MKTALIALSLLAATPAAAQVMTPAEYVKTAGASDLYERQSSQIVLQTPTSPAPPPPPGPGGAGARRDLHRPAEDVAQSGAGRAEGLRGRGRCALA